MTHATKYQLAVDPLQEMGDRAYILVARTIERGLKDAQHSATMLNREIAWPTLVVACWMDPPTHNRQAVVAVELRMEILPLHEVGSTYMQAGAPAWHQQIAAAEADASEQRLRAEQVTSQLIEAQRKLRHVREQLAAAAATGSADREVLRRMVAVLNGEASTVEEVEPMDPAAEAAQPWRVDPHE